MLIPIRCFTCGKVLADKYDYYMEEVGKLMEGNKTTTPKAAEAGPSKPVKTTKKGGAQVPPTLMVPQGGAGDGTVATKHFSAMRTGLIMDKMGLTRYCCRRHMLGTVDMMETI